MDFEISISKFWHLVEEFQGFGPQIRLQHAEIPPGTNSEVIWSELKGFPILCPVAIQWPVSVVVFQQTAGSPARGVYIIRERSGGEITNWSIASNRPGYWSHP